MEHKEERYSKESIATATSGESAHEVLEKPSGMLGSVWSAAGAIAESVQHAVQGTIEKFQQEGVVGVAHKIAEKANDVIHPDAIHQTQEEPLQPGIDQFLSSPTDDMIASSPPTTEQKPTETITEKIGDIYGLAKVTLSDTISAASTKASEAYETAKSTASTSIETAKQTVSDAIAPVSSAVESAKEAAIEATPTKFELTMDIVAHLQRIADRTGDAVLHDTARRAHSACAKGQSDAPGVHLVKITPEQATELVNLAIMTQDHELADFARYCQSVAATSGVGLEPSPGKIQEELAKGRQALQTQGRVHTGPGYGAAFASIGRAAPAASANAPVQSAQQQTTQPADAQEQSGSLTLTMDMVAHLQRIADRTGDVVLHETARKAHSAAAKNLSDFPGVHLVKITPEQATELVNLAIRTQDHELANFARYCQSVAATNGLAIEPTPGKIMQEIEKGRQELAQGGRAHSGPGYGAAFASISRSNSQQNLSRSTSQQNLSRTGSQKNLSQQARPALSRGASQNSLSLSSSGGLSRSASQTNASQEAPKRPEVLQLNMDVVAHLQRIADRTGDPVLLETARRAHSACAKNTSDVNLTFVTPDQATELVNLAIRTQDHELANFARYCQSVAATTGVAVEPSPGKIVQEIEKGRQELAQGGRAHTGPGYGAAFASVSRSNSQSNLSSSQTLVRAPSAQNLPSSQNLSSSQTLTQPKAAQLNEQGQAIESLPETKQFVAPEPAAQVGIAMQ